MTLTSHPAFLNLALQNGDDRSRLNLAQMNLSSRIKPTTLGVLLINLVLLAILFHKLRQARVMPTSESMAAEAEMSGRSLDAEKREIQELKQALAQITERLAIHRVTVVAPPGGWRSNSFGFNMSDARLLADKDYQQLYYAWRRLNITEIYRPIFYKIELPKEKQDRFLNIISAMEVDMANFSSLNSTSGPSASRANIDFQRQAQEKSRTLATELIGPYKYAEIQAYMTMRPGVEMAKTIASRFYGIGEPLSQTEIDSMSAIFLTARDELLATGRQFPRSLMITPEMLPFSEKTMKELSTVLTPRQVQELNLINQEKVDLMQ